MVQSPVMLFPEFLNMGSQGPAVAVLQLMLKAMDFDPNDTIIIDGEYGEMTAAGVRQVQQFLKIEADGHFGPATRAAFLEEFKLDVNKIPADAFAGETKEVSPS